MNNIDQKLREIKKQKRLGLMTHVVIGYPSLAKTIGLVKIMEKAGADFIELQIPFSDPLADGPTIMKACERSLKEGFIVRDSFDIALKLSKEVSAPLIFMSYYNIVFKYGVEKFCKDSKKSGISGLIIPDMPIEEEKNEHLIKYCKNYGLKFIPVISPVSTPNRLVKNAKYANGFIYFTARQGITGAQNKMDKNILSNLNRLRKYFSILIAVGFGISRPEHLKNIREYADIAVVGSAIIDVINNSKESEMTSNINDFITKLKMVK
jgi:tryptophan synthase alpha chain